MKVSVVLTNKSKSMITEYKITPKSTDIFLLTFPNKRKKLNSHKETDKLFFVH